MSFQYSSQPSADSDAPVGASSDATIQASEPLVSYKSFDDMPMFANEPTKAHLDLLAGVVKHGFERPSEIQQKIIVPIWNRRNVIAQSQSGTGKTGSFVIGSLANLDPKLERVQLIFIAHTHELATQIHEVVRSIGVDLVRPERVVLCVGQNVAVNDNLASITRGAQILVGTPGRIKDLVTRSLPNGNPLVDPQYVRTLVLDEADRLLSQRFYRDVVDIVNRLDSRRPDNLQICIFSATMPAGDNEALIYARKLCVPNMEELPDWKSDHRAPLEVLIPVEELSLDGIAQYYWQFNSLQNQGFTDKVNLILAINAEVIIPQALIYVNNARTAEGLQRDLSAEGFICSCIYGTMHGQERNHIIQGFRKGTIRILITTDLLSRGFDVQQVALVINFDLPYVTDRHTGQVDQDKMSEYLHRIGRSGRYGRKGVAINFVSTAAELSRLDEIRTYFKTRIDPLPEDIQSVLSM